MRAPRVHEPSSPSPASAQPLIINILLSQGTFVNVDEPILVHFLMTEVHSLYLDLLLVLYTLWVLTNAYCRVSTIRVVYHT